MPNINKVHIFDPDHNLYCELCGEGELSGKHGIIRIENGQAIYQNDKVSKLYADAYDLTGNEFYA